MQKICKTSESMLILFIKNNVHKFGIYNEVYNYKQESR